MTQFILVCKISKYHQLLHRRDMRDNLYGDSYYSFLGLESLRIISIIFSKNETLGGLEYCLAIVID